MPTRIETARYWRWATWALWLLAAALLVASAPDYGMSWDEMSRWTSGDNKLAYYKELFDTGPSAWGRDQSNDKYPGLYDLPLALYADVVGGDRWLAGRYWNVFWGLLALVGVSLLARRFSGWRAGFFATLFLLLLPRFYGHIPINPKDIPFAATYLLGVLGVVWLDARLPRATCRDWLLVGLLAGLAMAMRMPGMIILAYLGLLLVGRYGFERHAATAGQEPPPRLMRLLARYTLSCAAAYLVLILFFPAAHHNPFSDSFRVVSQLHDFSSDIPLLFRGTVVPSGEAPWYYLPWMLLITTPLGHLAVLLLGLLAFGQSLRGVRDLEGLFSGDRFARAIVVLAFAFPFAYILVKQPAIHNGIRHALFVLPPAAVIASWGVEYLLAGLPGGWARRLFGLIVCSYVAYFGLVMVRAHPYQYVYYNTLVGGTSAVMGRYETEYWFTATRHAVTELERWFSERGIEPAGLKIAATGPRQVTEYYLPKDWTWVSSPENADFFIGNTQFAGHLLAEGPVVAEIERLGLPIVQVKATGGSFVAGDRPVRGASQ